MFANQSLKVKLLSLSGIMAVLLVAVGIDGYWSLGKVGDLYDDVVDVQLPNVMTFSDIASEQKSIVIAVQSLDDNKVGTEAFKKVEVDLQAAIDRLNVASKSYEALPFGPGEEEAWKDLKPVLEKTVAFSNEMKRLYNENTPEKTKEASQRINVELPQLRTDFKKFRDKCTAVVTQQAKDQVAEAKRINHIGHITVLAGSVLGVLLSMLLGFFMARNLSKTMLNIAERLTAGSREVAGATNSIAEAGTELSASSTEQAAALQETVASLEEVSAMVNKSADNARRSLETSGKSQEAAGKGKQAVEEMIGSMAEINQSNSEIMGQVEQSNREISEIVKVIAEIGTKTKVINDIVFQTKLLSFNASVEAARAGEHGKGFAVVAEEVGNLAQMSGNAAKEISTMLEDSIRKVQGIADDTKSKVERLVVVGREKVEIGSATANRCASVLEEIVGNVSMVNQMVEEISTACREQAQGVQEINKAMGQLDQVTQQNSSAAQQSATAAEQLRGQTADLDAVVSTLYRTLQGGDGSHRESENSTRPVKTATKSTTSFVAAEMSHSKAKMKAKQASAASVIPIRKPTPAPKSGNAETATKMKRVSGGDSIPSENDPRFEDV